MQGLWLGIICALVVQDLSFYIITICTDWEQEVYSNLVVSSVSFIARVLSFVLPNSFRQ